MRVSGKVSKCLSEIAEENDASRESVNNLFKEKVEEIKEKVPGDSSVDEEQLHRLALRSVRCMNLESSDDGNIREQEPTTYTREEIYDVFIWRYCNGPKEYDYTEQGVKVLVGRYLNEYTPSHPTNKEICENGDFPQSAIGSVNRKITDVIVEGQNVEETMMDWNGVRRKVYERDDYTCVECGEEGVELHAHHIVPKFAGGEDYSRNLVTLCSDCHSDQHEWMN